MTTELKSGLVLPAGVRRETVVEDGQVTRDGPAVSYRWLQLQMEVRAEGAAFGRFYRGWKGRL